MNNLTYNLTDIGELSIGGNEMIDKAILKLTEEMNSNKSPYISEVGDKLIQLCDNEYIAEKILQEGKTIQGALNAMLKEAIKRKSGNSAVIGPVEGYNIIMDYFGIKEVTADITFTQAAGKKPKQVEDNIIDIMDFM